LREKAGADALETATTGGWDWFTCLDYITNVSIMSDLERKMNGM